MCHTFQLEYNDFEGQYKNCGQSLSCLNTWHTYLSWLIKEIGDYGFFIINIMFVKGLVHSLFLSPQSGVGPSISSSVIQCSVSLLVCISVPVLAVYFCPSSVRVVATFSGTVLFPLLCSVPPFFPIIH